MTTKKIRVVTYKRKSKKEAVDREEEPLARQNLLIDDARKWRGEIKQEKIVHELVDMDVSGSTDDRSGLRKLIRLAREDKFDRAYIGITSRLFRDLPNGPDLLYEMREVFGKEIIFGDVLINQDDPYYKRFESQRFLDAQTASIDGSVGAKSGQAQVFKDGFKTGGRARYGYKLKKVARGRDRKGGVKYNSLIVPNESTLPVVAEIFKIYAEGKKGVKAICTELKKRGIPGPSAWDSAGHKIVRCGKCRWVENAEDFALANLLCPNCNNPLILPSDNSWSPSIILEIISEAEWTYSGHYRANYYQTRIKHGVKRGQYKGGVVVDGVYKASRFKPASEWKIRRNNHQPAIDSLICKQVIARREERKGKSSGGRRRSPSRPFQVVCGECGALFSRRGGGVLACSGRERKLTECGCRGIKEAVLNNFVVKEVVENFKKVGDMKKISKQLKKIQKKELAEIPAELTRTEKSLKETTATIKQYMNLFEAGHLEGAVFAERVGVLQKEAGGLGEKINNLKTKMIGDATPFRSGVLVALVEALNDEIDPETIKKVDPQIKKIVSFVKLFAPDLKGRRRKVEIFYTPESARLLNIGVPKGI